MEKKLALNDFFMLTVLGKGSYAKVILVKKKDNGEIYALKILKKKHIELRKQEKHVLVERDVLAEIKHEFIVKLSHSFQSTTKLFFVLEYCPGGELFNLLQKKKRFNEDQARFYASQMVLAIEYLHSKDIIYRDLKPENVLLDAQGYIKITDFGLSKKGVKGKEGTSVCGTPEYLAPEILFKMGHGKAVDWWTLGAIIFEMLTGLPPFYTEDRQKLFHNIQFKELAYPPYLSPAVKNLFQGLFQKQPEKRLGSAEGASEIRKQPWFAIMNWDSLLKKELPAPFVPVIKNETDVSNFDPEFTEAPIESLNYSMGGSMINQGNFEGFTYNAKEKLQ